MIGVQKRKSTCSAVPASGVTSDTMTAAPAMGHMSELSIQHPQPAPKSSRKRTKLTNRSHSASLASQQQQQQNTAATSSRGSSRQAKDQYGQIISGGPTSGGGGGGSAADESVWIFGLINNIEQLLSTFTAINTNSTKSCNNSGTSTPTSLSSSFSFSSSNSSSSSLTPSRSASASSSATSSPSSASSLAGSPSSAASHSPSAHAPHHQQQHQQAAASHTTLSTLPRSPISRQIKFHEYKGPPSAKRQQQSAKPPPPQQQPPSSAVADSQQQPIDGKCCMSQPTQASYNRAPLAATTTTSTAKQQSNHKQQQAHESVSSATTALGAYCQATVAPPLKSHHNLCSQGFVQAVEEQSGEVRAYQQQQHQAVVAHSVPIRQPQQQHRQSQPQAPQRPRQAVASSAQDQLTSRAQCAHLQTFYINQQNTLENLAHGSALVLAPFIDTNARQAATQGTAVQLDHLAHQQLRQQQQQQLQLQPQQQQQPIQQLIQVQSAGCRDQQPPTSGLGPTSCGSLGATSGLSARFVESGQTQAVPPANVDEQRHASRQYQSPSGSKLVESLAADFGGGNQQQSLQDFSNYLQPFNHNHQLHIIQSQPQQQQQHHDFCSPQEFTSLSDDLATFGPDSEETDACEIEPSISFSHGAEELLFSEFIDLQDVPMNVDESDWLKKFLPPCSMG